MFGTEIAATKIGSQIAVESRNPIGQAVNDATTQIVSAVAQEMVNAVTQTAMKYTGQSSFGQALPQSPSGAYGQRANSMADQMRSSILGSQLPTRSLMPIARPFGRK